MENLTRHSGDPDCELVEQVLNGNVQTFEQLINRHSRRVYRTIMGILNNHEDAREAMQDTFLKAWQYLQSFERRSKFATWLISIAVNTAVQRLRERKPVESLDKYTSEPDTQWRPRQIQTSNGGPEEVYSQAQVNSIIERAMKGLPPKYRTVIILRYVEQLSTQDAAAALGLGIPALKARLLRGRSMLRAGLSERLN